MRTQLPILLCKGWVWIIPGRGLDCTVGCLFFLPLWLTPPYYELYVLCGCKTELIRHQDSAALVSKICFSVQNLLPPFPRDLSAAILIAQENLELAHVDVYQHFIQCMNQKWWQVKTRGISRLCLLPAIRLSTIWELLPVPAGKGDLAWGTWETQCAGQQAGSRAQAALGCETQ